MDDEWMAALSPATGIFRLKANIKDVEWLSYQLDHYSNDVPSSEVANVDVTSTRVCIMVIILPFQKPFSTTQEFHGCH